MNGRMANRATAAWLLLYEHAHRNRTAATPSFASPRSLREIPPCLVDGLSVKKVERLTIARVHGDSFTRQK